MDDLFASFLEEVDNVEKEAEAAGEPPEPEAKRPRTAEKSPSAVAEALRKAAFLGDFRKVQQVLKGLSPVERLLLIDCEDEEDGFAALHLAVIRGYTEIAEALISGRADVDVQSREGDTPLMWAAHSGNKAMVKVLLRCGADASLKNKKGQKAVGQAQAQGFRQLKEMLENHEFDVASGLKRRGANAVSEAAARRAANMAAVQAAIREQKEREEEEQYWAGVRARRDARETQGEAPPAAKAAAPAAPRSFQEELQALPQAIRKHFVLLSLPADATDGEVRKAYRKLALLHHPDKNPQDPAGAKQRFTEVAMAYEAICEYMASGAVPAGARVAPPKF